MPLIIGVPAETAPGERRLSIVPDIAKKYQGLGAELVIQSDAGKATHFPNEAFADIRWSESAEGLFAEAEVVLCVQPPKDANLARMKPGSVLIGLLQPWLDAKRIKRLMKQKISAFSLELLPRISRAQSMDVLSSQATVAGYECVLLAASHLAKFFPMLTYAAGTIRPAKVLVIGTGVAGLQAIATARRLGAMVEAYDVRPQTREQVESLGARFIDTGVTADGSAGYARELNDAEKAQQAERLGKAVAQCDALITTAAIPGKPAPRIVTASMLERMRPGSVVVDMAAESGGNVEGTVAGESVLLENVLLIGPKNLASRMPVHASEMYAKNLFNFISPFIQDGVMTLDWEDEVMAGACLTHDGEIKHEGVRNAFGL